ncbi:unnamed protein product [Clonostachys chloroleuca]|uniref:Protein-S-isoprenylcysteine O-methyltransferase n=1 Tax=Clonostachys chloroleuca TaxID=1926264 RepID=A0AA35M7U5_9HYPO|nr:unnamed protein product [Clonostachys chloroleuca]
MSSTPRAQNGNAPVRPPARRRNYSESESEFEDAPPAVMAQRLKPLFPGESRSLSGIALRAFCLGIALAASFITMAAILIFTDHPIWRAPFFLFSLALFHFLEFWTTAERNTLNAKIDSFLLTANWPSYAIAHATATLECLFVSIFFPNRSWTPLGLGPVLMAAGLVMTIGGQVIRSLAMLQAGASFNHLVQTRKAESHVLVTTGLYSVLRHPSYFGFFYWGLGTQLVLGNTFCFVAYALVLWKFFRDRTITEEANLIVFFGDDYKEYRKRVGTMIPFVP